MRRPSYGQSIPRAPHRLRGSMLLRSMHCAGYATAQMVFGGAQGKHREAVKSKQNGVIGLGPTKAPWDPSGLRWWQ